MKNNFGFTLLEIMIAAGIGSVVVLFAVTQLSSSRKVIGTSIVSSETSYLQNLVIANMSNPLACEKTFGTFPIVRSNFPLKDKAGNDFLTVGQDVQIDITGQKQVFKVTSISSKVDPVSAKNLILTVEYEINEKLERVSNKKLNSFNVDVYIKSAGGNIVNCFFDGADMIRKAVKYSCQGNAAHLDQGAGDYGTCTHKVALQGVTVVEPTLCPPGTFLQKTQTQADPDPDPNPNANPLAGTVNFICKGYSTTITDPGGLTACGPGEYVDKIDDDGKMHCLKIMGLFPASPDTFALAVTSAMGAYTALDLNCASDDWVLQRISPKKCIPKVVTKTCPTNQYMSDIDDAGNITCSYFTRKSLGSCPAGTYLTGINSDGSGQTCSPLTLPANCPAGRVLTAVDSNGNASWCQNVTN